jgi:O-antigen/teichoic acid export membrane protein
MVNLKQKGVRAMSWAIGERFAVQFANLFASMILARKLTPSEYGVIAIVIMFITISQVIVDLGFTQSLIASKNVSEKEYSSVFTLNVLISGLIYFILIQNASLISDYFKVPILTQVIPILSLCIVTNALYSVHRVRLQKELNFKRQVLIQVPGLALSLFIAILMALNGFGVWSLVVQQLTLQLYEVITYWQISNWRPHVTLSKSLLIPHFRYGIFVAVTRIFSSIFHYVYDFLIGKYFAKELLAQYSRAFAVKQLPHENFTLPIVNVSFPLFSSLKDDPNDLKMKYKTILQQVSLIVFPIYYFLTVGSSEVIMLLFGSQWAIAADFLFWLSISGSFQHVTSLSGTLFMLHLKNVRMSFILELISKGIFLLGAILLVPHGIKALLVFHCFFSGIFMLFWMLIVQWYAGVFFFEQLKVIIAPMIFSMLSAIVTNFFSLEYTQLNVLFFLIQKTVVFATIFFMLSFFFMKSELTQAFKTMKLLILPSVK